MAVAPGPVGAPGPAGIPSYGGGALGPAGPQGPSGPVGGTGVWNPNPAPITSGAYDNGNNPGYGVIAPPAPPTIPPPTSAQLAAGMAYGAAHESGNPNTLQPDTNYVQAFNASIGAQRQAIDNMLASSMSQLGDRRDAAAKVIAAMPGQVAQTYKSAEGQQSAIMNAANAGSKNDQAIGAGANAPLIQNELAANEAAGKAATPLVQLGATANYDLGAAGLQQQALAGTQAADQQQAAFDAQQAATQQAEQFQLAHTATPLSFAQQIALKEAGVNPSYAVNPQTGLTADQTATQARDANSAAAKLGYTDVNGMQTAAQRGPALIAALTNPNTDSDSKKAILTEINHDPNIAAWAKQYAYTTTIVGLAKQYGIS